MAGVVAAAPLMAVRAAHTTSKQRNQAAHRKHRDSFLARRVVRKYDKSNTGKLSEAEVTDLLRDVSGGVQPTPSEVEWVMAVAGATPHGSLTPDQVRAGLTEFLAYRANVKEIEHAFERFDTNHSGRLEADQLANLLAELNGGVQPTKEEVAWVLRNVDLVGSGGVDKLHYMQAVSLWYTHVAAKRHKTCVLL